MNTCLKFDDDSTQSDNSSVFLSRRDSGVKRELHKQIWRLHILVKEVTVTMLQKAWGCSSKSWVFLITTKPQDRKREPNGGHCCPGRVKEVKECSSLPLVSDACYLSVLQERSLCQALVGGQQQHQCSTQPKNCLCWSRKKCAVCNKQQQCQALQKCPHHCAWQGTSNGPSNVQMHFQPPFEQSLNGCWRCVFWESANGYGWTLSLATSSEGKLPLRWDGQVPPHHLQSWISVQKKSNTDRCVPG